MKPKVLIFTTCRWFSAARLAMAFAQAGCTVDALCPAAHPVIGLNSLHSWRHYRALAPLSSIRASIAAFQPDIILPCDDVAAIHLHRLHTQLSRSNTSLGTVNLLERSLGHAASYPFIESRTRFLELARDEGIQTPETTLITSAQQVRDWATVHGFPAVLKADGTSGGEGVKIVNNLVEGLSAYAQLAAPVRSYIVAKRAVIDRDSNLLRPWLKQTRRIVSMQTFVEGYDTNMAVACWEGEILATIDVEVVSTGKPMGPAAVVRLIHNEPMQVAAAKLVKRLNLSGLCGFDFMIDESSEMPTLIEINARATQTCHLALGPRRDLVAALCSAMTGEAHCPAPSVTQNETIALFPLAWQNDPCSSVLRAAYHDVPWEEPCLVRRGVARQSKLTYENWMRIWDRVRPRHQAAEKQDDV